MGDDGTSTDPDARSVAELRQAREALADARLLREGGGSVDGVVNRLYYACFHGARAVLYDRGEEPSSHAGVRRAFGQEVVLAGDVPREFGRLLSDLTDLRATADYEGVSPEVDVTELADEVDSLMDGVARLVET